MSAITLTFNNPLNTSVQVGDVAYYANTTQIGVHHEENLSGVISLGPITNITQWNGVNSFIMSNMPTNTVPPVQGSFIMFSKDNKANMSSILGYYAEVEFKNNSKTKAELFSVGTEVFESSK